MTRKELIVVKMNGEKTHINSNEDTVDKHRQSFKSEQAATVEHPEEKVNTYASKYNKKSSSLKKPQNNQYFQAFKPIIFASLSAVVIGLVLGFIMLKMFANIENEMTNPSNMNPVVKVDSEEKEKDIPGGSTGLFTLDSMHAFILQGGVFSEKANADESATVFLESGIPSVTWEKDDQYVLLVGISHTIDQANNLASKLEEQELGVYVKEWAVGQKEIKLTEQEHKWFQSFQSIWKETLITLTEDGSIQEKNWNTLLENLPEDSEKIASFSERLMPHKDQLVDADGFKAQHILLSIWKEYNAFITQ